MLAFKVEVLLTSYVDRVYINVGSSMYWIVLIDHLYVAAVILRDLIELSPLDQSKTSIGVSEAIGSASVVIAAKFQTFFSKDSVKNSPCECDCGNIGFGNFWLLYSTSRLWGRTAMGVLVQ